MMVPLGQGTPPAPEGLSEALAQSTPRFLVRIEAPYFVAAVDVERGVVVFTAPILHYMRGWRFDRVMTYAQRKGWNAAVL